MSLYVVLSIQSANEFSTAFHCILCCYKRHSHQREHKPYYSPHHKAWYPSAVQATSCRTVRGDIHSPSSHIHPEYDNFIDTIAITLQGRVPDVSGLLHGIISKCWLSTRASRVLLHLHKRTQMDIDLRVYIATMQCTNMH